jgi:hypothetical protein
LAELSPEGAVDLAKIDTLVLSIPISYYKTTKKPSPNLLKKSRNFPDKHTGLWHLIILYKH